MQLTQLTPLTNEYFEKVRIDWHMDENFNPYIANQAIKLTSEQAQNYLDAANELYTMFKNAAKYVIENNLFHEIGIPFNLVELVKDSWENYQDSHFYARFDLAGGIDGKDIKLIEFNADTPTNVIETCVIQWDLLLQNKEKIGEFEQYNELYEELMQGFKEKIFDKFMKKYPNLSPNLLFSSIDECLEDEITTKLLQDSVYQSVGGIVEFAHIQDVEFSDDEGVFFEDENYGFFFKLIPWELIATKEPNLALILRNISKNRLAIMLNPAYSLIFQSKGILKILWDLYPNHPLLLESSFEPLNGKKMVKKPFLAREGANISIIDENKNEICKSDGEYINQKFVYQEFYEFNKDEDGNSYQAGVFMAYDEASAISFRRGKEIINDKSQFVAHYVK